MADRQPSPVAAGALAIVARRFACGMGEVLVAVEADCERDGCPADCPVAVAARRAAVTAAELAQEWGAEGRQP